VLAEASVRKRSTARSTYTTTPSGQGAVRFTSTARRIHSCSYADLIRSAGHYTSRVSRHSSILHRFLYHPSPFSSEKNPRNVLPSAAQDTQLVFVVSTDFSLMNATPVLTFSSIKTKPSTKAQHSEEAGRVLLSYYPSTRPSRAGFCEIF